MHVHLVCPLARQAVNIKPLAMQRRHYVLVKTSKEASDVIATERWLCGTSGSSSTWVLGLGRECGTLSAPIWPACGRTCPRRRRLHAGRDLDIDASVVGNLVVQCHRGDAVRATLQGCSGGLAFPTIRKLKHFCSSFPCGGTRCKARNLLLRGRSLLRELEARRIGLVYQKTRRVFTSFN